MPARCFLSVSFISFREKRLKKKRKKSESHKEIRAPVARKRVWIPFSKQNGTVRDHSDRRARSPFFITRKEMTRNKSREVRDRAYSFPTLDSNQVDNYTRQRAKRTKKCIKRNTKKKRAQRRRRRRERERDRTLNAKITIVVIIIISGGDGNSIVTGKPGKPSRPDLKVMRRLFSRR